jgi:WS/DGAT/MGAT family acyltransferase
MHVGAVLVFEAGPLGLRHGGIDIERVRAYTASRLSRTPRAQQRSLELALGRLPTWVDDPFFDVAYHVRHVALPRPGDERQLKRLAARILSQSLDREKPPWELTFVEGVDENRFAVVAKADVALLDGQDGFDPLAALVSPTPDEAVGAATRSETQATPGRVALMRAELARRARELARLEAVGATFGHGLRGALNALERALASRGELPLTGPAGPHRRVEWLALDQADLRSLGQRLGASSQGVLLATIAGALRAFLSRRGFEVDGLEVRALTPIGVEAAAGTVDAPLVALPLSESDPVLRLESLRDAPEPAKPAGAGFGLLRDLARLHGAAASGRPASLCVSALSTPDTRFFLLGSALRECIAVAPLLPGHTVGLSATLFDGRVMLGFSGDAMLVADLPLLADAVAAAFDELRRIASAAVHPARPRADQSRVRNFGAEA